LKAYDGWRDTWSIILSGNFGGDGASDLLFYDRAAGVGEYYRNNGGANLSQLRVYDNWRKTWAQIVPVISAAMAGPTSSSTNDRADSRSSLPMRREKDRARVGPCAVRRSDGLGDPDRAARRAGVVGGDGPFERARLVRHPELPREQPGLLRIESDPRPPGGPCS
jgi:hypothetical protein